MTETVTVVCVRHRRKVKTEPPAVKGGGIVIVHDPPGNRDHRCDSARFTVKCEYELSSREAAHAVLIVLQLAEEHRRQTEDSTEENG